MVNLILNIPSANDGEHKDNNNIIKYFQSNKDSILNLVEKNYRNLVETLANNTVNSAVASSSNLTL
jgi:dihydroneopterin aldolase